MLRKKIIGLLLLATGWTACTQNFDEINTDPNRLEKIDPSTLMTPTLYDLANFNYNRAHSFTHHLMQFMVTTSTTGGVHRYADLQNAGNSTWNTYYLQLTNIKEMYELAVGAESKNYQAVALTLRAWVYANLTDCFGDVNLYLKGLGENPTVQQLFIQHARFAAGHKAVDMATRKKGYMQGK